MKPQGLSAPILHALLFIGASFTAGGIGNVLSGTGMRLWYQALEKPPFAPPDWVFGVVWPLLYLLMGVAAWLVWRTRGWRGARLALGLFFGQLALNAAWPGVFFGLRDPGAAFGVIVALLVAIVATLVAFARVRPLAALLFTPYLVWVLFAAALNFEIWRLNP